MGDPAEELVDVNLALFNFLLNLTITKQWRSHVLILCRSPKLDVNNIDWGDLLSDIRIKNSSFSTALQVIAFNLEFLRVFHGADLECHLLLRRGRGCLRLDFELLFSIRRICLRQPQASGSLDVKDLVIIRVDLQDSYLGKRERNGRLLIT